ncbi:hypothetical protein JB92DRAFT_2707963 [Gautieria morchelliformis]|nr:hypothetical protein JB92DRAFT_2707963 [Gautieria morchelliformis]
MHFQDPTAYGGLGPALGSGQQIDLNSPHMFKNNIHVAQEHTLRIQQLTQSAIEAIERAYQPNTSPVQASGEVIALKHALQTFVDFLRESGVGSLPLVASDTAEPPSEQKMIQDMSKSVQALFEKRQRRQENAAGIASLLTAPEIHGRRQS